MEEGCRYPGRRTEDRRDIKMALKRYKPTTPTRRWQVISDFAEITPEGKEPEKKLTLPGVMMR